MMHKITRRGFGSLIAGAGIAASCSQVSAGETTLAKIRRTGKLTVATEAAFQPFEFIQDGKIVGFGKDLLTEVVTELGNPVLTQLDLPWQGILPGLLAGKFDFVATTVGINEDRAKRYAYTLPYANGQDFVLIRKGDPIAKIEDLNGKVVATQLASANEPLARSLDQKLKADGGSGFKELKLYPAFPDTYVALANREVDGVIQGKTSLSLLMRSRPGLFDLGPAVEIPGQYTYLSWVTRPEDTDLRDFISGVIRKMRDDGRLGTLQEKWLGSKMDIPDTGYLPPGAI